MLGSLFLCIQPTTLKLQREKAFALPEHKGLFEVFSFFFFNPRNTHLQISRRELQGHLVQTYAEIPRYRDMLSDLKTHEDRQVPYLLHCIPSRYSVIKC